MVSPDAATGSCSSTLVAAEEMRIRTSVELLGSMAEIITRFMLRYISRSTLRIEDIIVCGIGVETQQC